MTVQNISVPQIIDIILLVIIIITAIRAFMDGFFTAVVKLIGNIAGLILSWILANRWAPMVFEGMLREKIVAKTYTYIQDSANMVNVQTLTEQFTGKLPASFMQDFAEKDEQIIHSAASPTLELAQKITDEIIGPIITVVIMIVIFSVLCSVCSLLAALLAKALRAINHIPVIGFANRLGGFGIGVFSGIINVIIISCVLSIIAVITQNSLSFINMEVLTQSKLLSLTSIINPFMG